MSVVGRCELECNRMGNRPDYLMHIFSPIDNDKDVMTQLLAEITDFFEATTQNESRYDLGT